MFKKDKIRLLKANVTYEKNNFHLLIQNAILVNALFINNTIRKFRSFFI